MYSWKKCMPKDKERVKLFIQLFVFPNGHVVNMTPTKYFDYS